MKFLTDFTYRNLHGFARFAGDSMALVFYLVHLFGDAFCHFLTVVCVSTVFATRQTGTNSDNPRLDTPNHMLP